MKLDDLLVDSGANKLPLHKSITATYGPAKGGKSSFYAQMPNTIFISSDKGLDYQNVRMYPCPGSLAETWSRTKNLLAVLQGVKNHGYECIVFDRIDEIQKACFHWVCEDLKIDHPSKLSFGKAWNKITDEFESVVDGFLDLPNMGKHFISLSTEREVEKDGMRYHVTGTNMPDKTEAFILGRCNFVFLAECGKNNVPIMRCKQDKYSLCCSRIPEIPEEFPNDYQRIHDFIEKVHNKTKGKK